MNVHAAYAMQTTDPVVAKSGIRPASRHDRAELAVRTCDVMVCVGTSSVVWPAAQLPIDARHCVAAVVQINPESTPLDTKVHYSLRGKAVEILPLLIELVNMI